MGARIQIETTNLNTELSPPEGEVLLAVSNDDDKLYYKYPNGLITPVGLQGFQGHQGPGLTGPQGAQGAMGFQGYQGVQGFGPTGPQGITGSQGVQGPQGSGVQGATGYGIYTTTQSNPADFPSVYAGESVINSLGSVYQWDGFVWGYEYSILGPQGVTGIQGPTGVQGLTGPQGFGPTGPQGVQGNQGVTGSTGNRILTTTQSNPFYFPPSTVGDSIISSIGAVYQWTGAFWTYEYSIIGPQGVQGPQGITGFQGASGGPQGLQGPTGPQGNQGPQGFQGYLGPQGFTGPTGSGFQGPIGPTGYQGPQGGVTGLTGSTHSVVIFNDTNNGLTYSAWTINNGKNLYYGVTDSTTINSYNLSIQDIAPEIAIIGAGGTIHLSDHFNFLGSNEVTISQTNGYMTINAQYGFQIISNTVALLSTVWGYALGVNGVDASTSFQVNSTGVGNIFSVKNGYTIEQISNGGQKYTNSSLVEGNIRTINTVTASISHNDYIINVATASILTLPSLSVGQVFWIYGAPDSSYGVTISTTYSTDYIPTASAGPHNLTYSIPNTGVVMRAIANNYWATFAV